MDSELLRPEVRKTITRIPRLPLGVPLLHPIAKFLYNVASISQPLKDLVSVEVRQLAGREHRIIRPLGGAVSRGAALWFHGGGHLAGKPSHLDALGSLLASKLGITFVAPQYRLAPKHAFPADLDDAESSWKWLLEQSDNMGIESSQIAIGGNSAGGGIAAALAQRLLDGGGPQPCAQVLFYPMLDDRVATNQQLDDVNHFIWNNAQNRTAWAAYLVPDEPGSANVSAYAAPARREDLAGLPPAWMGQCRLDLFFSEYHEYASRLKAAGVECRESVVEGVPHAFEVLCPDEPVSKEFVNSSVEFLASKLGSRD